MKGAVHLTRESVLRLCGAADVDGALRDALVAAERGFAGSQVRSELTPAGVPSVLGLMPAYRADERAAFAAKVVCVVPGNPARGMPAHQGLVLLFDAATGAIRAMADAGAITEVRTAAMTRLAIGVLAADRQGEVLVVGAGHQSAAHLRAFASLDRPLRVWARRADAATQLVSDLRAEGVRVELEASLETGVRRAAVVVTLTGAAEPILRDEWLRGDQLIAAIGSSTPRVREVAESTLRRARVIADDPASASRLSGEFVHAHPPLPAPVSLGSVLSGAESVPADGVLVYKAVGAGVQDLALLAHLADLAEGAPNIPHVRF